MTSKELGRRIKEGKIDNIYLLYGGDDYIKEINLKRIKDEVLSNDITGLNFTQFDEFPDKNELIEAIESSPVMSEKKVVCLNGLNLCAASLKKEYRDVITEILKDVPEYTVLIIKEMESDVKNISKPFLKLVRQNGVDVSCDLLSMKDLSVIAVREFLKNNKKISTENADYLVSICDGTVNSVLREVEVISAYLNDEEIVKREVIDLLVKRSIEDRIFDLSTEIINGNKKKAFEILDDLKLLKNQNPAGKIFAIVCEHFVNMYCAVLNGNDRISADETMKMLSLTPNRRFLIDKYQKQGRNISIDKMRSIVGILAELDYKIKNGQSDPYYAIEEIIAVF